MCQGSYYKSMNIKKNLRQLKLLKQNSIMHSNHFKGARENGKLVECSTFLK